MNEISADKLEIARAVLMKMIDPTCDVYIPPGVEVHINYGSEISCEVQKTTFGIRLRQIRKACNVSQRDLAERIKVDFTYISKIESGAMPPPSEEVIHRIAEALETDESELFCLAGKVPNNLKALLKDNSLLAELVYILSKHVLPDETYQKLIEIACRCDGSHI